jgi:hypothetical protein
MSVEVAVDLLVSMNVNEESYACLEILNKYFLNGAKPEEKYRRIKKTNDVYQVMQTSYCSAYYVYVLYYASHAADSSP